MVRNPILARFQALARFRHPQRMDLHTAFLHPEKLPAFVKDCSPAMRFLNLVGSLPWQQFPDRNLFRDWGQTTIPYSTFSAVSLLKLNENLVSMDDVLSTTIRIGHGDN